MPIQQERQNKQVAKQMISFLSRSWQKANQGSFLSPKYKEIHLAMSGEWPGNIKEFEICRFQKR
jgi:hypothetical protein